MDFIKKSIKNLIANQLIAGSAVLFVGNIFASFGNYLYHLLMGRMLGPVDYGVLASLISVFYLLSIPVAALVLVIVKYVSALRGEKKLATVNYFYRWINRKLLFFGLLGFLIFLIFSSWISSFLHLESNVLLILIGLVSFIGIFSSVNLATLQGFLRFGWYTIVGIVSVVVKLVLAIVLVYLSYRVFGAILAILMGAVVSYLLALFYAKKIIGKKEERQGLNGREVVSYTLPVFFSILAFTSLYTTDIVLARHFLPSQEAGFYAALATLGKIIFFASSPIAMVMFPMVSERHANGKKYVNLLGLSLGLVFLACLGISGVYFFFPKLMINILYGSQYLPASSYLWLFAIFLSFYSFCYLLVNFFLSIKKVKVVLLPVIAAAAQVILISIFHQSLSQIIWVSINVLGLLLIGLLLYYFLNDDKTKKALTLGYRSRL